MALVVRSEDMPQRSRPGWQEYLVGDEFLSGALVLSASKLVVEPNQRTAEITHEAGEQMVYVVSGSGQALVNGTGIPLEPETMVWLEAGDRCAFEAGQSELVVLRAAAPPLAPDR